MSEKESLFIKWVEERFGIFNIFGYMYVLHLFESHKVLDDVINMQWSKGECWILKSSMDHDYDTITTLDSFLTFIYYLWLLVIKRQWNLAI